MRDMLLAEKVRAQARSLGLTVCEIDGSRSVEEMATLIERHFEPFLRTTCAQPGGPVERL